jgi:hypothetical protein
MTDDPVRQALARIVDAAREAAKKEDRKAREARELLKGRDK